VRVVALAAARSRAIDHVPPPLHHAAGDLVDDDGMIKKKKTGSSRKGGLNKESQLKSDLRDMLRSHTFVVLEDVRISR